MSGNSQNSLAAALAIGLELGFLMALPLAFFLLLGIWLDKKFGTMPLFVIVCLLAGLGAVFLEVKRMILPFLEKGQKTVINDKLSLIANKFN